MRWNSNPEPDPESPGPVDAEIRRVVVLITRHPTDGRREEEPWRVFRRIDREEPLTGRVEPGPV